MAARLKGLVFTGRNVPLADAFATAKSQARIGPESRRGEKITEELPLECQRRSDGGSALLIKGASDTSCQGHRRVKVNVTCTKK